MFLATDSTLLVAPHWSIITIGSNLQTDLGQAAMIALAARLSAFPVERHAGDLMAALFYESSGVIPPIIYRDGAVRRPAGPGFGVVPM